jgi:hypothetical protein
MPNIELDIARIYLERMGRMTTILLFFIIVLGLNLMNSQRLSIDAQDMLELALYEFSREYKTLLLEWQLKYNIGSAGSIQFERVYFQTKPDKDYISTDDIPFLEAYIGSVVPSLRRGQQNFFGLTISYVDEVLLFLLLPAMNLAIFLASIKAKNFVRQSGINPAAPSVLLGVLPFVRQHKGSVKVCGYSLYIGGLTFLAYSFLYSGISQNLQIKGTLRIEPLGIPQLIKNTILLVETPAPAEVIMWLSLITAIALAYGIHRQFCPK